MASLLGERIAGTEHGRALAQGLRHWVEAGGVSSTGVAVPKSAVVGSGIAGHRR